MAEKLILAVAEEPYTLVIIVEIFEDLDFELKMVYSGPEFFNVVD
ncbi:hypothetical protein [Pseudoalteromonas sp. S4389]|nr:hypothetical protein [Pseudoalteromonas sp. S4389]